MKELIKERELALMESVNTLGLSHHSAARKKLNEINAKIKEKQERIDKFATAQLSGLLSKSPCSSEWFEKNLLKDVWGIAELMESERDRRINKLNK